MTHKTRNFVIASLLILGAGVGTGLVAYYGFPTSAFTAGEGPDELSFLPANATVVAYADVHEVMTSELRQKLRTALPFQADGQQSFQNQTGINIETDIDRVVFGLTPSTESGSPTRPSGLVVARGRFDVVRIEAFMRDRGATVDDYKGTRIITAIHPQTQTPDSASPTSTSGESISVAFLEAGLVGLGSSALVRRAIDLKDGGDSVRTSDDVMNRVRALDSGNVWAVGRFDALTSQANLERGMVANLPAITWFSASGQVDSGLRAMLKAETRDEESANGLRDVVRGFMALARMQTNGRTELQTVLQSIQLGGSGQTVSLSVDLSPQAMDALQDSLLRAGRLRQ
jgi:hypothetical protein